MSTWDNMPRPEEVFAEMMQSICCMTPVQKYRHLYQIEWGRPNDSTFYEIYRIDGKRSGYRHQSIKPMF